ncbi:hypothetical protein HYFRA_00006446 [Hymenoscyphus fraxineus]|uniref:Uncharacterized protein n=1 Tax=Hymenoscyphus fraxineus TaxID=746836 RepID=A0A9N9KQ57_9HELO|nr:hypothetical protein HYFRA_00006446 [Hymenoscyphus fraxineus]
MPLAAGTLTYFVAAPVPNYPLKIGNFKTQGLKDPPLMERTAMIHSFYSRVQLGKRGPERVAASFDEKLRPLPEWTFVNGFSYSALQPIFGPQVSDHLAVHDIPAAEIRIVTFFNDSCPLAAPSRDLPGNFCLSTASPCYPRPSSGPAAR